MWLRAFLADPAKVGDPYGGEFVLWQSSGSQGSQGSEGERVVAS